MLVSKDEYFSLLAKIDSIPFVQSRVWIETNSNGSAENVIYIVNSNKDVRISCIGLITRHRYIGTSLIIRGVCRKRDVNETELRKFFLSILELNYDSVYIIDGEKYDSEFELAIRRAGFVRPLGLQLSPMTLFVDLQQPFSFHRNWRRNVKKSIENGNVFRVIDNPTHSDASDFVQLFKEQSERKGLGYSFSAEDILHLLKDNRYTMLMVSNKDGRNISGRIVFISGTMSYDVYAANSYEGINTGAVYQVQEGMLSYLKAQGVSCFDYGLIPPRADEMDDIYLAKSYSGGYAVGLNGEWCFYKSLFKHYLTSFLRFYVRKSKLY